MYVDTELTSASSTAVVSTRPVGVQGDAFCLRRSASSEGSVCERAQDEEAILLLPDPLQQFVDSRYGQSLGPQRTEAEVELKATCHLQEEGRTKQGA